MASRVMGRNSLKRKLRRVAPAVTEEIAEELRIGAERVALDARGLAPRDQGDLAAAIERKESNRGLSQAVGPGVRGYEADRRGRRRVLRGLTGTISAASRDLLFQFSKGLWHEFGTKGDPERNVPPLPATPFMGPAFRLNVGRIRQRVRRAIRTTLDRVSRGG